MTISNVTPASGSDLAWGASYTFEATAGYTTLLIRNTVVGGAVEAAYDSTAGGAASGYTVVVVSLGGTDQFTVSRDAGWSMDPTTIYVTEDTVTTTSWTYDILSGADYPEGMRPYNDAYSGPSAGAWGTLTGTLSDQTDLQAELDAKGSASAVALNTTHRGSGGADHADVFLKDGSRAMTGALTGVTGIVFTQASAAGSNDIYVDDGTNYIAGTLVIPVQSVFAQPCSFGAPGFEQGGININGVTYDANVKLNEFGGTADAQLVIHRHSTTIGANTVYARSKSNDSSHGTLALSDEIASLFFVGWTGTHYDFASRITASVDDAGTVSATSLPGKLTFHTCADGSTVPTLALTLSADKTATFVGNLVVGGTVDGRDIATDGSKLDGIEAGTTAQDATLFTERADHVNTPATGKGELWIRNDAPTTPMFTDDAGGDHALNARNTVIHYGGQVKADGTTSAWYGHPNTSVWYHTIMSTLRGSSTAASFLVYDVGWVAPYAGVIEDVQLWVRPADANVAGDFALVKTEFTDASSSTTNTNLGSLINFAGSGSSANTYDISTTFSSSNAVAAGDTVNFAYRNSDATGGANIYFRLTATFRETF